jgi:hypothetical protein
MADFSELDGDARKAEATRRLAKLFGMDIEETAEEAAGDRVRFRDYQRKQILRYILQDMEIPEALPKPPPKSRIATPSQLKDLIRELELSKPLTWLSCAWWRSLFTSYGSTRFCWDGCYNFENYPHNQNYELGRIRLGAWRGCPFCSVLLKAVLFAVPKDAQSPDAKLKCVNGDWTCEAADELGKFRFELFGLRGQLHYALLKNHFDLSLDDQPLDPIKFTVPGLKPASLINGNTSSNESLAIVQKWLEQCVNNHDQCGQAHEAPLPKRILDVSKKDVFLYESKKESSRYICLSHCWGASRSRSMTTSKSLSTYKKSIPWGDFSQNFKDAIDFCRRLQIQYIWIDCLCIVQDDELDWREQSAEMYSIYSNAFLTLAATSSENSDGGCYVQTPSQYMAKEIYQYGVYVRTPLPLFSLPASGRRDPEPFPLLYRA